MARSKPRKSGRGTPPAASPPGSSTATGGWGIASGLAAAGALVSGYLLVSALRGYSPVCLTGACDRVAASPYARMLGLPVAAWGLMLYLVVGTVAMIGCLRQGVRARWLPALFGSVVFGAAFSGYLVWLQVGVLGAVCAWCAASAVLWALLLVTAGLLLRTTD